MYELKQSTEFDFWLIVFSRKPDIHVPYLYVDMGAAVLCASFMSFGVKRRWFAMCSAIQLAISTYASYVGEQVYYGDWLKVSNLLSSPVYSIKLLVSYCVLIVTRLPTTFWLVWGFFVQVGFSSCLAYAVSRFEVYCPRRGQKTEHIHIQ